MKTARVKREIGSNAKEKKRGGIAQREGWRGHWGREAGRCSGRKKQASSEEEKIQWGTEGCRTERSRLKKTWKKGRKSETEGGVEGWEVDRQITTKLRLADSCESRIWYCGTDTQTQTSSTYADADTRMCVRACTRTNTGSWGHTHMLTLTKRATLHMKY